jgi:hypothetical protein
LIAPVTFPFSPAENVCAYMVDAKDIAASRIARAVCAVRVKLLSDVFIVTLLLCFVGQA